ncbi:unnamed protein product [Parnassius apollo]|uniref:(apollo) hypothetical protein n=1 Tax=Parnassius apollo TaxID=110799 RepID=A0A8S3WJZ5_PARAO|nr:unnamed protein product [Parnassius apollo]
MEGEQGDLSLEDIRVANYSDRLLGKTLYNDGYSEGISNNNTTKGYRALSRCVCELTVALTFLLGRLKRANVPGTT